MRSSQVRHRVAVFGAAAVVAAALSSMPAAAAAQYDRSGGDDTRSGGGMSLSGVPTANPKADGLITPDVLSAELAQVQLAQGATRLENGTPAVPFYGYDGDKPTLVPLPTNPTSEAHKTEPDKNTYLVFNKSLPGADAGYRYGAHFLFQGHESGTPGYLTRINLDADAAHRVTLLATTDTAGANLPDFDGSTWDPFAQRLLFTAENGNKGGVWQADLGVPATVQDISGVTGRGGYEGVQNDDRGNVYLVEDVGGKPGPGTPNSKQPNSFVYRLVPTDPKDLTEGGKLQVLQVQNGGTAITFSPDATDADILGQAIADLHTYGKSFTTSWVTIHDTATAGTDPFDANALAKAAKGTAFKRPENGVFAPDGKFRDFYFTETGDTNANTEAGAEHGGFGAIMHLTQNPRSDTGTFTMLYRGDVTHTGLDNISFVGRTQLVAVEDAGDLLHTQRNALDSGYLFDTAADYAAGDQPTRVMAQGRDASATIDSACAAACGNDGDNEITGIHTSNGDPSKNGILGAATPRPFQNGWRIFYTRQHGDNVTFEIIPNPTNASTGH
jgi:hypothetical protein